MSQVPCPSLPRWLATGDAAVGWCGRWSLLQRATIVSVPTSCLKARSLPIHSHNLAEYFRINHERGSYIL